MAKKNYENELDELLKDKLSPVEYLLYKSFLRNIKLTIELEGLTEYNKSLKDL